MDPLLVFFWGAGGSVAVEIVSINQYYNKGISRLPKRYKNPVFWLVRLALAAVAGGLALAYEIEKPLLAANIGAATPLIIQALAEGIQASPKIAGAQEGTVGNAGMSTTD